MKKQLSLKSRYSAILNWFASNKPDVQSELCYKDPFQLLVAVILSAQCTDKRVNMTTPALFDKYPTPETLANASIDDIYNIIKSISYPRSKSEHIIGMAKKLVKDFASEVPSEIDLLMTLPGVGRKTANVIASIIYDKPVIAVDTHVFRISRRLGLSKGDTVEKVEKDLTNNIPENQRAISHHWLILHGRYVCTARNPKCESCPLSQWCATFLGEI